MIGWKHFCCILSKFYIKPQLSRSRHDFRRSCILSKFYIKPQRKVVLSLLMIGCILSKFYIKPQPSPLFCWRVPCCILSKFYIKPQRRAFFYRSLNVVSYRNSTSNHNNHACRRDGFQLYLIEILHQTTTGGIETELAVRLYLIEILHQTTTTSFIIQFVLLLYLIEILHQTTTERNALFISDSCILSKFYIKPQRRASY